MNTVKKCRKDEIDKINPYSHLSIVINDNRDSFFNMILAIKKCTARHIDYLKTLQKQLSNMQDYATAKVIGQEAKDTQMYNQACKYIISSIRPDILKDCPKLNRKDIPLTHEQHIKNIISFAEVGKNPWRI